MVRPAQGERGCYVKWGKLTDRKIILKGPDAMATHCGLALLGRGSNAFQIAFDLEYIAQDCFSVKKPVMERGRNNISLPACLKQGKNIGYIHSNCMKTSVHF